MNKPNIRKVFHDCGEYEHHVSKTELTCFINIKGEVYINIGDPNGDEVYENQCIVLDAETTKELIRTLIELLAEIE